MYNLSEIMKRAHTMRTEEGMSMGDAMRASWNIAKIDKVSDAMFMLNMKDRHNAEDRKAMERMSHELIKLSPKPERRPNYELSEEERERLMARQIELIIAGQEDGEEAQSIGAALSSDSAARFEREAMSCC